MENKILKPNTKISIIDRAVKGAKVVSVNISERRGTIKKEIEKGYLRKNRGLVGDAHADPDTHRQVSLLAVESVKKMEHKGLKTVPGLFAENINTESINLLSLQPGSRISIGKKVILEITQIGKECHSRCEIYTQVGDCIMPREGVFARVIRGGPVQKGDRIFLL
jgi:MOSC domain-containing protein YiiM